MRTRSRKEGAERLRSSGLRHQRRKQSQPRRAAAAPCVYVGIPGWHAAECASQRRGVTFPWLRRERLPRRSSSCPAKPMSVLPDLSRLCANSSRMPVGSRARPRVACPAGRERLLGVAFPAALRHCTETLGAAAVKRCEGGEKKPCGARSSCCNYSTICWCQGKSTWRKTLFRMLAKTARAKLATDFRPHVIEKRSHIWFWHGLNPSWTPQSLRSSMGSDQNIVWTSICYPRVTSKSSCCWRESMRDKSCDAGN